MITLSVNYGGRPQALQIADDEVLTFPGGLVGCGAWRRFVLLSDDESPDLHILQCVDEPAVRLLVARPMMVEPAYRATISLEELRQIGLTRPEEALLLCILTIHSDPPSVTANLLGPLVVNPAARLGIQLVLTDSPYSTRRPLPLLQSGEGEAPHVSA